jgi:hypothetical protein
VDPEKYLLKATEDEEAVEQQSLVGRLCLYKTYAVSNLARFSSKPNKSH